MNLFDDLYAKRPPSTIKPGLERIRRAYEYLERPGSDQTTVLIGGTNGKGTTAGYLVRYLEKAGKKVGLYTSPHLQNFSERFYLSHRNVDDLEVRDLYHDLEASLPFEIFDDLSFFEVATLIALRLFSTERVDVVVLEVGLGGAWDATNITSPDVSVITSVGLDHMEFLGDDVRQIAAEKAGIMRTGKPVVVGDLDTETAEVIVSKANEVGANLSFAKLPGEHSYLIKNRHLAWVVAQRLGVTLEENSVSPTDLPMNGRFQFVRTADRRLLLDVCHNPAGARAFVETCKAAELEFPLPGLVSIMGDKDIEGVLRELRKILSPLFLFRGASERSFERSQVDPMNVDLPFYDSFGEAFAAANDQWQNEPNTWVCCGSVATVGEVMGYLSQESLTKGPIIRSQSTSRDFRQ